MDWANFLAAQNVMTIGLVLVLAIGLFAFFLRRKSNRRAASNAFSGDPDRSALARKAENTRRDPGPASRPNDPAGPPR
ncbi:hypothetical protein [Salinarimonas rosea]|uniref:hypothetical protein n=1 Tax=Salinarimonas rosea TaxID=552063 RepID=UPI0003F65268|nr:hypothetical protein [Salinarimonas rosea]